MNYFDEGKNADDNFNNNDIESTENQGTDSIRDVSDNDISDKDKYNNNSENDTDNGCETGEYEYGISYSSSGVEDNTGSPKAPKNSIKSRKEKWADGIGRKFALVALTLAAVLLLNMFSAMAGAKIAIFRHSSSDKSDGTSEKQAEAATHTPVNIIEVPRDLSNEYAVTGSAGDSSLTVKEVWQLVHESVVEIRTETVKQGSILSQYVSSGAGSGVIIGTAEGTNDYYLVTNNHVIDGASTITVILTDGTEFNAKLVGTDELTDVAVIKITSQKALSTVKFGQSNMLAVGEDVVAIGNPLGKLGGTTTNGIISAVERDIVVNGNAMKLLQTNAAVNPGNSGGGLFNMAGELIGIVNAKYSDDNVEGLAFAIPSDTVKSVSTQLLENGYVKGRPTLGITVTEYSKSHWGLAVGPYVIVVDPRDNSDFKINDQIVRIDGNEISTMNSVNYIINQKSVGDTVTVTVYRNTKLIEIKVKLKEYVPSEGTVEFVPDT